MFKTFDDADDIKPVLVTDMSAEQLQEILNHQKTHESSKDKKKRMKEAKLKEKQKKARWVKIDEEGNTVKAVIETEAEKHEKKRLKRKERKREIKLKFLEEQNQKKMRRQELMEKLDLNENKRHDTDSDDSDDSDDAFKNQLKKPEETRADNMRSGLQTAEELAKEIEENKRSTQMNETEAFDQLKAQKTVIRDKDGRAINNTGEGLVSNKDRIVQMNVDRLAMWSKGVVQTQKTVGNNEVDPESHLKQGHRFGDPMAEIRLHQRGEATDRDQKKLWSRKIFPP